jgi:CBS domain containing-hemolysin-like protein
MASKKVKGAKTAINLIKNAEKVSSFCNDVIGDVCGIISGSMGIVVANKISVMAGVDRLYPVLFVTATVAALTIGGKALGKSYAVNRSNVIIYKFASFLAIFK